MAFVYGHVALEHRSEALAVLKPSTTIGNVRKPSIDDTTVFFLFVFGVPKKIQRVS